MKKLFFVLCTVFLLSGCSSPPKPQPFPNSAKTTDINSFVFSQPLGNIQLNRFDQPKWYYSMINQGATLSQDNTTKFWYLAQHATKITLHGNQEHIENLRLKLKSEGARADILLKPNGCINTKKSPCEKVVHIEFEKEELTTKNN